MASFLTNFILAIVLGLQHLRNNFIKKQKNFERKVLISNGELPSFELSILAHHCFCFMDQP